MPDNRSLQRFISRSPDGANIVYRRLAGPQSNRPTLALLHSLAMDHTFWLPVVHHLRDDLDVIAIDARGHGESDKPSGPYSVELFADDLAAVLEHAQVSFAVVAGASMGGSVSLAFAKRHSTKLAGLALIDTTAHYGPDAVDAWEKRGMTAVTEGLSALTEFQQTRWFSDRFRADNPDVVEQSLRVFLANEPDAYLQSCRMLGQCDMRSALGSLQVPTKIIVGEDDYATPVTMARQLQAGIADSKLLIVDKSRHYTPIEESRLVAGAIEDLVLQSAMSQSAARSQ